MPAGLGLVLLDSAVFVYAVGSEHGYRQPCRRLLDALAADRFDGVASVLAVEEVLHQRARRTGDRGSAHRVAEAVTRLCRLLELTPDDVGLGLRLFKGSARLHARDALHAATAVNRDIPVIVSPDPVFDDVARLDRIDPVDAALRL